MQNKKHSHLTVFLGLALLFIGFIAFASYEHYKIKIDDSTVTVRLKWLHNAQFAGMYLAENKQMYSNAGIKVKFEEHEPDSAPIIDSLIDGSADLAIMSPLQLLEAVSEGEPVKAVAAIYQQSPSIIGSLAENNIKKPSDLKNKTFGTPKPDNFSLVVYNTLLEKNAVPTNAVNRKVVGFETIESLVSKKVDAASFYRTEAYFENYPSPVDLNYIKPEDYGINLYDDVIVVSTKLIEERPELVQKFITATIEGWDQALDYPAEGVKATLLYAKDKYRDQGYEQHILSISSPLIRPNDGKGIGQMHPDRWQEMYQIYRKAVVTSDFNVSKAYTTDFLP